MVGIAQNGKTTRPTPVSQDIPADTVITLERGGSIFPAPTYKLRISADGKVTYEGQEQVKTKGRVESQITQSQLEELLTEFDNAKYFTLRDSYPTYEENPRGITGCPEYWADMPWAVTSLTINGKTKTISHNYGCRIEGSSGRVIEEVFPTELTQVETKIDEIVGTRKWIE